jgi:hypothetical protein
MFFNNVGRRNTHVIKEVGDDLFFVGGGAICENARHFHNMHQPPFRTFETCAQISFFFLVELMECVNT